MLAIVAILLIFCLVVRRKWRNAAAEKEEILRLVAMTSEEEAVIAKLQDVQDVSFSLPQPLLPPQLQAEKQHYCAVCYSPTTTRCAQCKSVRYCSGKCQIIHWRQGHKDDCRPIIAMHARKESESFVEAGALENQFEMHLNKTNFVHTQEHDDSESSCGSLPSVSSSTEQTETSFDASTSEVLESGTSLEPERVPYVVVDSHVSQTSRGSDDADKPSPSSLSRTVCPVNNILGANMIKLTPISKADEGSPNFKPKRNAERATASKEFILGKTELRSYQSSSSVRTSVAEDQKSQALSSSGQAMRSTSVRGSVNQQMPNVEFKNSQFSKSLKSPPSDEYWQIETQLYNGKETRIIEGESQKLSAKTKTDTSHALPSDIEGVRMISEPISKGLKTSVRKLVQHFKTTKQSKSGAFDMGKDSGENFNHKVIFPPKLFVQLYSCDSMELQPFGLANCGNSCYANAVLQCLTFTRPITSFLLQGLHSKTCRKRDWCFICEFECLIRKGQEVNFPLSPAKIMSQIPTIGSQLSHGREEDAHEFLRNVLDKMQSICLEEAGVSGSLAEDSTLVGMTFGGYLRSKIKCMKCSGRSDQCDRIMDLTVEIDGNIYTLEEALAQFTTSETLGGDDKYKCSRCKSYEKAKKKLTVLEAPNILTIVLKRFQSSNLEKLSKLIRFPEVLNLAPYISGMNDRYPTYHLYAVVVHLGMMNAAYSGHYISYVKDFRGDWFRIDDSRVCPVDLETVLSVEAYILFYARQTPRSGSLIRNSSACSDGIIKRNMEAISSSNSSKKKNTKTKPSPSGRNTESTMVHQRSEKHHYWMSPNDFTGNHVVDPEGWGIHLKPRNPILVDSSSDCSSIFSASDAGSYSTDSTKDSSSAEELSGYIFGGWYNP